MDIMKDFAIKIFNTRLGIQITIISEESYATPYYALQFYVQREPNFGRKYDK